jgi:hypothetical protein
MQCHASNDDMLLPTRWETWHSLQYAPLLLQDPKCVLNDIAKGRMQKIEYLILSLRCTLTMKTEFR